MLSPIDGVGFRIGFLRAMAPQMGEVDLAAFRQVVDHAVGGSLTVEDLETLETLFKKFDKVLRG